MTERKPKQPLDIHGGSPSQNGRMHAATKIQSPVTPEQYPESERDAQVAAATGQPNKSGRDGDEKP
ncbi:hypothetical protein [Novosphingobium sp. CECT 9465]|uniref:hypothetical protein n=1 Tax=Novosphingobium sp. CECT 9465 TaxID=2829794 RepID=UPI001E5F6D6C|nr:hypothetical protein [Novosphingobium sp. CECT 9465]CAH0496064.1 hypothetical protein NVSP9465_01092 [Novosphingobium sp. CECT 9465]